MFAGAAGPQPAPEAANSAWHHFSLRWFKSKLPLTLRGTPAIRTGQKLRMVGAPIPLDEMRDPAKRRGTEGDTLRYRRRHKGSASPRC